MLAIYAFPVQFSAVQLQKQQTQKQFLSWSSTSMVRRRKRFLTTMPKKINDKYGNRGKHHQLIWWQLGLLAEIVMNEGSARQTVPWVVKIALYLYLKICGRSFIRFLYTLNILNREKKKKCFFFSIETIKRIFYMYVYLILMKFMLLLWVTVCRDKTNWHISYMLNFLNLKFSNS